jgi:predicted AlkP superfamily pyrophosphatase or phosphodiesterase
MEVKNNYQETLTNLACSIRKYFGLTYQHQTLKYVDKLLEDKKPNNVIVILYDGMGSKIIKKILDKNDFFIKNQYKEITTVFPATTTAATTSIRTGLNPVEHGWLGWNTYIKPIDKIITMFLNTEKGHEDIVNQDYLKIRTKELFYKTIVEEINDETNYQAFELMPFGDDKYKDLDDMLKKIKELAKQKGKKYLYAYDSEPDSTMHNFGACSKQAQELIKERNQKTEELVNNLQDAIIFIIADHGHINVDNIYLKDYPEIKDLLERNTSGETRSLIFKVKAGQKAIFKKKFNQIFANDFNLYTKDEIIASKLYGDGKENPLFRDALGDFIAISKGNKALINDGDEILKSNHAGYSDDEIYIPLIIIDKTK